MATPAPVIPKAKVLRYLAQTIRNPIGMFSRYARQHGDTYLFTVSKHRRTLMTIDADIFQQVLQKNHRNYEKSEIQTDQVARYFGKGLLTNEGKSWLKQRRLIQPGFSRVKLEVLAHTMQAVIAEECAALKKVADADGKINLHHLTRDAVFRIIVRAIFTDGFSQEDAARLHHTIEKVQGYIIYPVRLPFLRGALRWLGLEKKHVDLSLRVRADIQARIDARRAGQRQDDLLQMLLDIRYQDTGEGMTDEQLVDEILILFAAGHETSANSLAWTIWLLLRHPDKLEKVRAEITAAEAQGPLDFAGVRRLPYLTQVIDESLRMYPPAWLTDRVAHEDDNTGEVVIEAGVVIGLFVVGLHRNPKYWDAPDEFRPERMTPEAKKSRHPGCYVPFGGGPRLCIGNHFAMLEMLLFLVPILRDFDFVLPPGAEQVRGDPAITLRMDRAVVCQVNSRTVV